jgi:CO dehydrogenase maturation factor
MSMKVIVAGKGGSGKSTIATLLARLALKQGRYVMVVDADESNPGIERMLGLSASSAGLIDMVGGRNHVFGTLRDAPSDELKSVVSSVMERAEGKEFCVVQVGKIRNAGSGCACPHGAITREILSYPFKSGTLVLVDAEAGVEHFGRGIDAKADMIIFIVDPSYDSIMLCEEAKRLADSIHVKFHAVLNKVDSGETSTLLKTQLERKGIEVKAVVPYDTTILGSTLVGEPLEAGPAMENLRELLDEILEPQNHEKLT